MFFQEAGIRKGVRRGDGILVGILQRAESGYGFSKRVQITNYPFKKNLAGYIEYINAISRIAAVCCPEYIIMNMIL